MKKNQRILPPIAPRRLVLLVATALAGASVHAGIERVRPAPITFERNMGQFEPEVLFVTKAPDGQVEVRAGDVSISPVGRPAMRLRLSGANIAPAIEEHEPVATRSNYYGGRAGRGGITGVPHFGRVVMKDVYPNVDLALHGAGDELEYDFVVAPGADPSAIRIDLSHADAAWLDEAGNLRMRIDGGELTQRAPFAYQGAGERMQAVPTRFELHQTERGLEAGFVTAGYDRSQQLVIDPIIAFSAYLGSSGGDWGGVMKIDANGLAHSAKLNRAPEDLANILAVQKFDRTSGFIWYNTQIHGEYGITMGDIVARTSGSSDFTYVTGSTVPGGGFLFDCGPCVAAVGGNGDGFVIRLSNNGTITAGQYLGGSGADEATGLAIDALGNVYVSGNTSGPNFPATVGTHGGGKDVFVARLPADLSSVEMAVLIGGPGDDTSSGIAVDSAGNMYVPTQVLGIEGSDLVKLAPDGSIQHSTYLGASGNYVVTAVAVDPADQPVVAGIVETESHGDQAFVWRLSSTGDYGRLDLIGGTGAEFVRGVTAHGDHAYVAGGTNSADFQRVASEAVGASGGSGGTDAFVARVGSEGVEFATRFGGAADDFATAVSVAPNGDVFVMGSTTSSNFPMIDEGLPPPDNWRYTGVNGGSDLFFARIANQINLAQGAFPVKADESERILRITRTGSLAGSASVKWTAANGSALAGTHYGTLGSATPPSGTVTFDPGVGTVDLRIGATVSGANTIRLLNTATATTTRTFTIALSLPTGAPLVGSVSPTTVSIQPGTSSLTLLANNIGILESSGSVSVQVLRAPGSNFDIPASVAYATANATALAGSHYHAQSGTLTWPAGDGSAKQVVIPIIDNAAPNPTRTFRLNLSAPTGAPISGPTFATVSILDQDNTVALAVATQVVTEGAPSAILQVKRTGSPTLPASVSWSTENVSAVAGTEFGILGDPTAMSGTLSWVAGDAATKNIVIPLLDDATAEPGKTFKVNLSGVAGATLGTATTTVTLSDNERGFDFPTTAYNVTEGQPSVVLTVRRLGSATAAASLTWSTANGSAIAGQDFGTAGNTAQRTGTLTWAMGDAANKTITIPILNDTVGGEPAETFTVMLTPVTAGYLAGPPATVTINDNDPTPQSAVQFGQAKYLTIENAGTVTLEVNRVDVGGGFGSEARVNYATVAGTAMATSDYVTKTGTLIWPAGDSSPKSIVINLVSNTIAEPNEAFRVVLNTPNAGTAIGATSEATVVILDDDEKFPPGGAIPAGFSVPVDATRGWHVAGDPGAYEGAFALRSDAIDDGETAAIEMEGTFAAGNVTFRVRVSSEAGFDLLRFYVDGVLQATWSGTTLTGWQTSPAFALAAGHRVLRWEYAKDASMSVGQDAAFIDALVTPAFTP